MTGANDQRYERADADALVSFATAALEAWHVPPEDAAIVADSLVTADLWGHQSHGVMRLPWYVDRLRSGVMRPVTDPTWVTDSGAVVVLDGHDGVGQVLAYRAASTAIARARRHGLGAVGVRNSNHFGTAAYYTRLAPPAGCIGVLVTNGSPAMAPWGGREKVVGNNPWSIAAPAGAHEPLVLDIANTAVARGKIYLARQRDEPIPEGWALDPDGRTTTDPVAAIAGTIAPMAGHKGYAISVMMDVLAGVLTGSGFGPQVSGPYQHEHPSRCGHLFLALDVGSFLPVDEFHERMEQLVAQLRSAPLAEGADAIHYPGELEHLAEQRHRRDGLPLPARTLDDLGALGEEAGVSLTRG
ncbi:Ldh family oxidoreductase [Egibacter rhizosphaerae]|uniref:Ldh family oxidoreductase n=1 Tax=Egibacter rhizosphaerae TaxID=1670831 RepID=A0A411YGR3_9ACTN|nr:Ldh family oxidoreductase [Egibacter rhizosphaerae]QBI20495.1 Ldh family oxidoreductase [Egibacter rhizosphaerae]